MADHPLLQIANLDFSYGDLRVLRDVSLEVQRGEIVSVVGSNGAGKSTLLRAISRLLRTPAGAIRFEGQDLSSLQAHEVVELGIIHVPEGRRIFPEMTVLENLLIGSHARRAREGRKAALERVLTLFPRLSERAAQAGGTLSGGEQQMLAIGRGLMANPQLLLLDEPSLGLAPLLVQEMFRTVQAVHEQGVTILLVEQNVSQSLRISDLAAVLETGAVALRGTGAELLADAKVRETLLGA